MKYLPLLVLVLISCKEVKVQTYTYPEIFNDSTTITKFGTSYTNYFSNMEDLKNKDVATWLTLQDSISKTYFSRKNLSKYLKSLDDGKKDNLQSKYWYRATNENGYFYWIDNDSLQVLYKGNKKNNNDTSALTISIDEYVHFYEPSSDGTKVQVILSNTNGDFLRVIDTSDQEILFETTTGINPNFLSHSIWVGNDTIVYTAFPDAENSKDSYVALSNIITGNTEVIFSGSNIENYDNEDYLIPLISNNKSNNLQVYVANATEHYSAYNAKIESSEKPSFKWRLLFSNMDSVVYYANEKKDRFYFLRYKNGKKIFVESASDSIQHPYQDRILFEPEVDEEIASTTLTKNKSYVTTVKNGTSMYLYNIDREGGNHLIDLDYPISHISFYQELNEEPFTIIQTQGWNKNYSFFDLDDSLNVSINEKMTRRTPVKYNNIVNEIIEVASHDGTMVPMTIVRTKNYEANGANKAVIHAYGAYGLNIDPIYSEAILDFVSKGNIFAVAHVRGGAEKGLEWYNEGVADKKINSWKDLLYCSQYLKDNGFSKENGLGVLFSSAGGITCGMAINEKPEMYNAVVGISAMFNPIRLSNQVSFNAGDNDYDFGTVDNEKGYNSLLSLDPIVNFNIDDKYPSTLIMMGKNDDLIPLYDAEKYIGLLQQNTVDKSKPYILDIFQDGGHNLSSLETTRKAMFFFNNEL